MRADVQHYYGEVLQSSGDLKTSACCTDAAAPGYLTAVLKQLHDEVLSKYYGCGLVLPEALEGMRVLDLGCGAGRDCYVLSCLVGESGHVTGVDMTPEQLAVARKHQDFHAERFGYARSNVEFIEGDIERLEASGLESGSFDIIVSNCVINLVDDKQAVLDQAWRLLKPGGEFYFADVYVDRRVPEPLKQDPVLRGECLSGALYWNDFLYLARNSGFVAPHLVIDRPLSVDDPGIAERLGAIRSCSATVRLFKVDDLEPGHEDYGQTVKYLGTVPHHGEQLVFDKYHAFATGVPVAVSSNTFSILGASRLRRHFEFCDPGDSHRGQFASQPCAVAFDAGPKVSAGCGTAQDPDAAASGPGTMTGACC